MRLKTIRGSAWFHAAEKKRLYQAIETGYGVLRMVSGRKSWCSV